MRVRRIGRAAVAACCGIALLGVAGGRAQTPPSEHPRLWLRSGALPLLRSWATPSNPAWRRLERLAGAARHELDTGLVPGRDGGGKTWEQYPSESYAELFAFLSLVEPSPAQRLADARRARRLLLHVIRAAAAGAAEGKPFRDPAFSTDDRSRWWGEALPLTVDWIHPYLSRGDLELVRRTFLRWAGENTHAETTTANHPEPVGLVYDRRLTSDRARLRWTLNNYYTAHARNLGLMALALDPADDPGGRLRGYLRPAIGAWLYTIDAGLRTYARGGLSPEGFEYGPQSLGYVAQILLALHSAQVAAPRAGFRANAFWRDVVPAWLQSLSPAGGLPAWYGDGQRYAAPDPTGLLAPLGIWARAVGERNVYDAVRWIVRRAPVDEASARDAILRFVLLDPCAPDPRDPRPRQPLGFFAPGTGRILARTSWAPGAGWFTYGAGSTAIDHQHGDGNSFELFREGEWLTKEQTGYDLFMSDFHNTLAIENDRPEHDDAGDARGVAWRRGSQWPYVASGDGRILAHRFGKRFVYVLGDATRLYNSAYERSTDVLHASRSIVWLEPGRVVVYDRADTRTAHRFKRFWLQLPSRPHIVGRHATARTLHGQRLVVSTLLPLAAGLRADPPAPRELVERRAHGEPMRHRLLVEGPGGSRSVRFLHVLQALDGNARAEDAVPVRSRSGTPYAGAAVGQTLVLFPVELGRRFSKTTYPVPPGIRRQLVTGLIPGGAYTLVRSRRFATVLTGGALRADSGGVLVLEP